MKTGMEAVRGKVRILADLARHLKITPAAVSQWKRVPAEHIGKVADFTGLPHCVIRPDLFTPGEKHDA